MLPPGSLSSDESAGRRSSKSGSRRTAALEHKIPGDSRRRAVMARRYPCDARVEGIEQRRFPLPLRLLDAHVERRAHHETLELRLHDPVRAAGTRQAQLVATLRAHASPSRFISSTARLVGIITGEYKVRVPDSLRHASSANRVAALKRSLGC